MPSPPVSLLVCPHHWHVGLALQLEKGHTSLPLRGALLTYVSGGYNPS